MMVDIVAVKQIYPSTDSYSRSGEIGSRGDGSLCDNKISSGAIGDTPVTFETPKSNLASPDEFWLFKPQSFGKSKEYSAPIDVWLREIFDSPSSCFFNSRRNLLSRLEAILITKGQTDTHHRSGSVPSLHEFSCGYSVISQRNEISGAILSSANSSDNLVSNSQHSEANLSNGDPYTNVGTFTRVRRAKHSLPPQHSSVQRPKQSTRGSNSFLSSSLASGHFSSKQVIKTGSCDELEKASNKANVQEIARIQEDNLKAEVAALAAAAAERHGSQHSIASLSRDSINGSHPNIASAPESPHSSTSRLAYGFTEQNLDSRAQNVYPSSQGYATVSRDHQTYTASHVKHNPYSLLPQKPIIPNVYSEPPENNRSHVTSVVSIPQVESRNHFGFRSSGKSSFHIQTGTRTFKRGSSLQYAPYSGRQA